MAFFCLSFLMPGLINTQPAQAETNYNVLSQPVVKKNTAGQSLGTLEVSLPTCSALKAGDVLTISFPAAIDLTNGQAPTPTSTAIAPSAARMGNGSVELVVPMTAGGSMNALSASSFLAAAISRTGTTFDITLNGSFANGASASDAGFFYLYFNTVKIGNIEGDITANVVAPTGSCFSAADLVVAQAVSGGGLDASVESLPTITGTSGQTGVIHIWETVPGSLAAGDLITLKLPAGFTWGTAAGTSKWGWAANPAPVFTVNAGDAKILNIDVGGLSTTTAGQVSFSATINAVSAQPGDINVQIYETIGNLNQLDMAIAHYGTSAYPYTVLSVPTISPDSTADLGTVQIDIPSAAGIATDDTLTLQFSDSVTLPGSSVRITSAAAAAGYNDEVEILVPPTLAGGGNNSLSAAVNQTSAAISADGHGIVLTFAHPGSATAGQMRIYIRGASIASTAPSDITAALLSSKSAIFPSDDLVVARLGHVITPKNVIYKPLNTPFVVPNTAAQALGTIEVDISNCSTIRNGDVLTLTFPSGFDLTNGLAPTAVATAVSPTTAATGASTVEIVVPMMMSGSTNALCPASVTAAGIARTGTTLDITFNTSNWAAGASPTDKGIILIHFNTVKVGLLDGDVTATLVGPAGSAFPYGTVLVAKSSANAGTIATVKSMKTIGSSGGVSDSITVSETAPGRLPVGDVVTFKLPVGFAWAGATGTWDWGWAANGAMMPVVSAADNREIMITIPSLTTNPTGSGQFRFAAVIRVDDAVAQKGPVAVHLSDTAGKVTETDLTIAEYTDFGVDLVEGTCPQLIAGKHDQKIGEFWIKEKIKGSLLNGRQLKLVLPEGVKWSGTYSSTAIAVPATYSGNVTLAGIYLASPYDTWKMTVTSPAAATRSEFDFKNYRVDIAPNFSGPLTITVTGDAGVSGEIIVGEVKPVISMTAENCQPLQRGVQNQALGSLLISETRAGTMSLNSQAIDTFPSPMSYDIAAQAGNLTLTLPTASEWAAIPTVQVIEGNLQLKLDQITKNVNVLTIPVKTDSTIPSTIRISNIKVTTYNTIPDGPFVLQVDGTAINETGGCLGGNTLAPLAFPLFQPQGMVISGVGSVNAQLSEILVNGKSLAGFAPTLESYEYKLPQGSTVVPTVQATAQDSAAQVEITPADNLDGSDAERTAIIKVTAANGSTSKEYRITLILVDPGTIQLNYLEKPLNKGWNILSIPLKLELGQDSLGQIVSPDSIVLAYRYDNATNNWAELNATASLAPMDSICINMKNSYNALLHPSTTISGPYTRTLPKGWNMIGPALDISSPTDNNMFASRVLKSLGAKFSQAVSQRMGYQVPWTFVPGDEQSPTMYPGEGYWVYMLEDASLAGYSMTPVQEVVAKCPSSATLSATEVTDTNVPTLPAAFYGTVTDQQGNAIASGTIVVSLDGVVKARKQFDNGQFGMSLGQRLLLEEAVCCQNDRVKISVNGYPATLATTPNWAGASGTLQQLNLVVDTTINPVTKLDNVAVTANNSIELSFTGTIQKLISDEAAFKAQIALRRGTGSFAPLAAGDTVTLNQNKLIITLSDPLTENSNQLRIAAAALADADGNPLSELLTPEFGSQVIDECFIATAAFGSKFMPAVKLLRAFRDDYLLTNAIGSAFVEFYYHNSPPIAATIRNSEGLKTLVKVLLSPAIAVVYLLYHPTQGGLVGILVLMLAVVLIRRRKQLHATDTPA